MAATFAPITGPNSGLAESSVPGSTYTLQITMTGDTSYPTGGYPFGITQLQAALQAGMTIQYILVMSPVALISDSSGTPATTGYIASMDYINGKVQLFQSTTGAPEAMLEVASTTNVSAAVVRLLVFYR
jgi:hypothetical protein